MNFMRAVTPAIAIGDQPTEADLAELKKQGFSGIINLRNDGEPEQPMNSSQEGEKARALGLEYLHYGVGDAPLSEQGVTAFATSLTSTARGRARCSCIAGEEPRPSACAYSSRPGRTKRSASEVVAKGKAMGLEVEGGLRCWSKAHVNETAD